MNIKTLSNWDKVKLEGICSKVTDGTHDTPQIIEFGYPLIKGKDISKGYIDFENCDHISKEEHEHIVKRSKPEYGDILFANIGNSIGDCVRVNTIEPFSIKNVALFKPDSTKIFPLYLFYVASSQQFIGEILNIKSGAAQPFVSLATLRNHKVLLPPLPTQQKIAHILSAYDDLIENNLKRIRLLEEMAQITYEQWFVRMKFPNHETTPTDAETGLPEGWRYSKLSDEVELIRDSILPSKLEQAVPYIGLEHMPRKSITLSKYGSSNDISSLKINVKKGDILFGKIRPYFHKIGIALKDCITSTDNIVVRPKNNLSGIVLQTMFSEPFISSAVQSSNGTKMPRANWKVLQNHKVIVPDSVILDRFSTISVNLILSISNLSDQNQLLKEARDILLPRLMTGMINVNKIKLPAPNAVNTELESA